MNRLLTQGCASLHPGLSNHGLSGLKRPTREWPLQSFLQDNVSIKKLTERLDSRLRGNDRGTSARQK
jgi:hypothetical protein